MNAVIEKQRTRKECRTFFFQTNVLTFSFLTLESRLILGIVDVFAFFYILTQKVGFGQIKT